ncbi:MAG: ATP synthase F0 subunit B [Aquificae bacterium]|nr:ATP synthase F0 subunit B [Aquificota bacterium]
MKKFFVFLMFIASVSLSFASETADHPNELFWKTVNTLILLAGLAFVIKKWGVQFFKNRRESVKNMVEEAQKAHEESLRALKEAQAKLEEAENKFQESLKIAEETAKKEREAALKEAQEIAERIKLQAKEAVEIEIKRGEAELKKYATKKALEISEKLLKEKVNPEVERKMIEQTLKALS